jgi:UDP-N-acetylglucosamine transferase subunit ALG13
MASVAKLRVAERLVVQRGSSRVPIPDAEVVDFLSFEELTDHVRRARLVVSHAGVGSIMVALAQRRRPIVVPRLARFGEAVDDHQTQVASMLGERGSVTVVRDPALLQETVTSEALVDHADGLVLGPLVDVVAHEVERAVRDAT